MTIGLLDELFDFVYYGAYTWDTTGTNLLLVVLDMGVTLTTGSLITSDTCFTGTVAGGAYCFAYWSSSLERLG